MQLPNDKILLVLDLDETLIHATKNDQKFSPDFEVFDYKVIKRPSLEKFLINCSQDFRLAIWSSATDDYVAKVVENIIPKSIQLEFVWGRSKATYRPTVNFNKTGYTDFNHFHYIKRLKKVIPLGFKLERTLIVDDTPHKSKENYGNAIYVKEYKGENNDNELQFLEKYLHEIKDCPDIRKIEKRGWRTKFQNNCG